MGRRLNKIDNYRRYLTNRHVLTPYPLQVGLEVTNHCNLKCVMCPHSRMTRPKGYMSKELFVKIIDEIKGKSEFVYLHGFGESLLHPQFFELARYAAGSGLTTLLSTNITLLDEDRSRKLLESGIDFVVLAMDGTNKDTYEKIRVGGKFDSNILQIKKFLQLKKEFGAKIFVELQFILMDANKDEASKVESLFTESERRQVNVFRIKPKYTPPSVSKEKIVHRHPCYFLWNTMTIAWNGEVPICCMDYDAEISLGNVNTSSVPEIWNGARMASLRSMHKKLEYEKLKICDNCSLPEKDYFSPLTILANAFLSAGTLMKALPLFEKGYIIKKLMRKNG